MKISDLTSSGINGLAPGAASPASGAGAYGQAARGAYGQTADQVQLSGASRLATSAMADHSARLSQLKSLVASGQYDPPADAIGKALLNEALSLSSSK
jgi:anti-sigma28 factor (negative regulator of flagellin synthesis)